MINGSALVAALALAIGAGCTALGPTPATTAVTARPAARPEVDLQAAIAPGYFLSSAVVADPAGAGIQQLSAVVEPDRWIALPGLIAGARIAGNSGDAPLEPMLGYRATVGGADSLALAGIVFGTRGEATADEASYEATRGGIELGADLIIVDHPWAELHGFAALTAHAVSAEGEYCVDPEGFGRMCPDPPPTPAAPRQRASVSGAYGAATAGLALAVWRDRASVFHGARVAVMFAAGTMPRVIAGEQEGASRYASIGLALSIALGPAD